MTPTFSIIVPTILRPTLAATLDSIQAAGLAPGDEVLVMVDAEHAHKPLPPGVRASRAAPVAVYYSEVSRGGWGGPARNLGVKAAKGSHLLFIDDDDVYRPGAIDTIRAMVAEAPATIARLAHAGSWRPGRVELATSRAREHRDAHVRRTALCGR
jgi:glycosyltransferase involved in cell wall biosynthesis